MKPGDRVKYSRPQEGEADLRFVLVEHNGDRVVIESLAGEAIPGQETVATEEICLA
jgi:hypothetical protein